MKKPLLLLLALAAAPLHAGEALDTASASRFLQDFYQAVQQRDEAKISAVLAEDAPIRLTLLKNAQTFTLSRADWLQQLRAAAHFGKTPRITLDGFTLSLTQAGYSGTLHFHKRETGEMLDQKLRVDEDVEADLRVEDDRLKITGLRIRSSF
ncbi:hypothetical protein EV700_1039 [Fluviicoccus keumensis]|uniref:SnoaL-like domain-containing protein n=1 Tax=Fluviicoccus keumensis TaxID=1435465 RepID=A0A4Q7ZBR2_9GAMM|nr:hypothetical protein [Fluviicoccus keumensis]RZU48067.1 hypothetical protein EV700_1039 [Fluviicoccus keumensis]